MHLVFPLLFLHFLEKNKKMQEKIEIMDDFLVKMARNLTFSQVPSAGGLVEGMEG
jgi:hypothetical protein